MFAQFIKPRGMSVISLRQKVPFLFKFIDLFPRIIPMLIRHETSKLDPEEGLLECCNTRKHWEMLLHEDFQPLPQADHIASNHTTESCTSSKQNLFAEIAKTPNQHKISLIERRNSMNQELHSKKQTERPTLFHQISNRNCKMIGLTSHQEDPEHKKETVRAGVNRKTSQNKTSLKRGSQNAANRPYLVQFSFMEVDCDRREDRMEAGKGALKRIPSKNQPMLHLAFKENNLDNKKAPNLRLGENLPTYRSEFNNTNETCTRRSQLV